MADTTYIAAGLLADFGLPQGLIDDMDDLVEEGAGRTEIILWLQEQPAFIARFPQIKDRRDAGLPPITPTDVLNYEHDLASWITQTGLRFPTSGPDFRALVAELMTNDVSPTEMRERVLSTYRTVSEMPPMVTEAFRRIWGVSGRQSLASVILSPEISATELVRSVNTATVEGFGREQGIGVAREAAARIGRTLAPGELMSSQQLAEVRARYENLSQQAALFRERMTETRDLDIAAEGVEYAFGLDAESREAVERRLEERTADVSGRGGQLATQAGVTGAGEAV